MDEKNFGSTVKSHSNCCSDSCIHTCRQSLGLHVTFIKEFNKITRKWWSKWWFWFNVHILLETFYITFIYYL